MLSEPLDISIINANVGEYWRVNMVELTASTQSDLVSLVRSAQAHPGDVITAEFQSRGRGRLSRSFEAPTGTALLFSFFIAPVRSRQDRRERPGAEQARPSGAQRPFVLRGRVVHASGRPLHEDREEPPHEGKS